jgi:hypothetical protein
LLTIVIKKGTDFLCSFFYYRCRTNFEPFTNNEQKKNLTTGDNMDEIEQSTNEIVSFHLEGMRDSGE